MRAQVFSLRDPRGGYLSYLFFVFAVEHYPDGGETLITITVDDDPSSAIQFRLYEVNTAACKRHLSLGLRHLSLGLRFHH